MTIMIKPKLDAPMTSHKAMRIRKQSYKHKQERVHRQYHEGIADYYNAQADAIQHVLDTHDDMPLDAREDGEQRVTALRAQAIAEVSNPCGSEHGENSRG